MKRANYIQGFYSLPHLHVTVLYSIVARVRGSWKSRRAKFRKTRRLDSKERREKRYFFPAICRFVLALCPPPLSSPRGTGGVEAQEEERRGRRSVCAATMVHAAVSQLHPRCTCLPSFRGVPLAERERERERDFPRNRTAPRTVFHQLFLLPHSCILPPLLPFAPRARLL